MKPVITPARKIPFALRPRLKDELDQLTEKGVIAPVNEPTEWVSALALDTKKSGELRICIDPRPLNKALRREHYKLPTLDEEPLRALWDPGHDRLGRRMSVYES